MQSDAHEMINESPAYTQITEEYLDGWQVSHNTLESQSMDLGSSICHQEPIYQSAALKDDGPAEHGDATNNKNVMLIDFDNEPVYDPSEHPEHELSPSTRDSSPRTKYTTDLRMPTSCVSESHPLIEPGPSNGNFAHILTANTELAPGLPSDEPARDRGKGEAGFLRARSGSPAFFYRQDVLSSSPLSSPPQIFTSSPFHSSQSSAESDEAYKPESLVNMQELTFSANTAQEYTPSLPGHFADTNRQLLLDIQAPSSSELSFAYHDRGANEPSEDSPPTMNICAEDSFASSPSSRDVSGEGVNEEDEVVPSMTAATSQRQNQQDACACSPLGGYQTSHEQRRDFHNFDVQDGLDPSASINHQRNDPKSAALHPYLSKNEERNEPSDMVAGILGRESKSNKIENLEAINASQCNALEKEGLDETGVLGKRRRSTSVVRAAGPSTKRPKVGLFREQEKKLSTPFRAPVMKKVEVEARSALSPMILPAGVGRKMGERGADTAEQSRSEVPAKNGSNVKERHRTKRASLQFKSPLLSKPPSGPTVRLTPTLQGLESKLQHLKRAVKIKQESDADILKGLTTKWTEAGREVAWEVWDLVKGSAGQDWGTNRSGELKGSWGWAEDDGKADSSPEEGVGQEIRPLGTEDVENEDKQQDTLGTMLHQVGIAHETLGWNEEEGSFQDD